MTRIYTRSGDKGLTGLIGGKRLIKSDPRFTVIGDIDELNSILGLVISTAASSQHGDDIEAIQGLLFEFGAELAGPTANNRITAEDVAELEAKIDRIQSTLDPLSHFLLPGGNTAASFCHQARAVCRRAERHLVALDTYPETSLQWLNRLSDWLFVLARSLNKGTDQQETSWQPRT